MLSELVNRSKPLKPNARVLVLGGGYSGGHVARLLRTLGTAVRCSRRSLNVPDADLVFDSKTGQIPMLNDLDGITHVLSTIPPTSEGQDPVLTQLGSQLRGQSLTWIGYLSTTGVYGDRQGAGCRRTIQPSQASRAVNGGTPVNRPGWTPASRCRS